MATEATSSAGSGEAPGWDAIEGRMTAAFPGQQPLHWKPDDVPLPAQGGLWGLSVYRADDHWFFVTYGLSDLFGMFQQPEEDDPSQPRWSGFGLELTMRVAAVGDEPPTWPLRLLDSLGKYVYSTQRPFADGHRMDPGGPITGGNPPTRLTGLAFTNDPVFETIDTPLGLVEFVAVVGITADELATMKATSTAQVLDELRRSDALLVTDPAR